MAVDRNQKFVREIVSRNRFSSFFEAAKFAPTRPMGCDLEHVSPRANDIRLPALLTRAMARLVANGRPMYDNFDRFFGNAVVRIRFFKRHRFAINHLANTANSSQESDAELLAEFQQLWDEADSIWDQHQNEAAFGAYVSADYLAIYHALKKLQGQVVTVLEWGSGLGVVAIMASRMGFDAYGIEAEGILVERAVEIANKYRSSAQFSQGSFIPDDFVWTPSQGDEAIATSIDDADGYDQFDMDLRDFDLIYGYPWPDEHDLFHNIIREFGRPDAMLLTYDAREGTDLIRFGDR